jgi:O-antigen biosynthesis protein
MSTQHLNYTREVVAGQEESLAKITAKIAPNSLVLDVGCGTGMLGKFLSQHKQCVVDGVDIDSEAVALAKQKYRKTAVVNLESGSLAGIFNAEAYDCIVMADVIEHLVHPEQLFGDIKQLLKPDGILLFSIPNITHISAGLELVLGKFGYSGSGLLDSTHVRFYSRQGFIDTLEINGIYPFEIDTVVKAVDETEFNAYRHFPQHWIRDLVHDREDALTYQWIVSAKLFKPKAVSHLTASKSIVPAHYLRLGSRVYWRCTFDESFSEINSIAGRVAIGEDKQLTIYFEFTEENCRYPLAALRIDPVCDNTAFIFLQASLISPKRRTIWFTKQLAQEHLHNARILPATDNGAQTVLTENNDPQWNLHLAEEILEAIVPGTVLSLKIDVDTNAVTQAVSVAVSASNSTAKIQQEQLSLLAEKISQQDQQLNSQRTQIAALSEQSAQKEHHISLYEEKIAALSQQSAQKVLHISQQEQQIAAFAEQSAQKELHISQQEQQIAALAEQSAQKELHISQQEQQIAALAEQSAQKELRISQHEQQIAALAEQSAQKELHISQQDQQIKTLTEQCLAQELVASRQQTLLTTLSEQSTNKELHIRQLTAKVTSLTNETVQKEQFIHQHRTRLTKQLEQASKLAIDIDQLQNQVTALEKTVSDSNIELLKITTSNSWRITQPLRSIRRYILSIPSMSLRASLSDHMRSMWRRLPIALSTKGKIKHLLFNNLSFLFHWSTAYKVWESTSRVRLPVYESSHSIANSGDLNFGDFVPLIDAPALLDRPVKLVCFYLPQFHAIEENDLWWGKGFTEWTNVRPAQPQFAGHYQPHVPGELGYYNLLDDGVQRRQVELAQLYGIGGFCFYFYWFGGKRLLETPVENYLADPTLKLPFCLCWANENWSRRWDGLDHSVLIAQQHSAEDDLNFISYISKYLSDERYIRVSGKPLLVVYRPSLLPNPRETVQRWRKWCVDNGIGEIYIAYTQSFEAANPSEYGFDAAIEFPPNNSAPPLVTDTVTPISTDFHSTVYDWRALPDRSEHYQAPPYKLFRSVCPSWDNTPRRKSSSTVFINSSPQKYQRWLENAIEHTLETEPNPDDRFIFVNAWNEWAEGAHLEPDARYGYAWLQASRNALTKTAPNKPLLLVTHDCHPHGAQFLTLEIGRQLVRNGFSLAILALDGGKLYEEFARLGTTFNLAQSGIPALTAFLARMHGSGYKDCITSTVVTGSVLPALKAQGFKVLSLIHELPGVIHGMKQESNAATIATLADKLVFPAALVRDGFTAIAPVKDSKIVVRPQGLLRVNPYKHRNEEARLALCERYQLPQDTRFVVAVGYLDHRKGADLFADVAGRVIAKTTNLVFIWVGHAEPNMQRTVQAKIDALGIGHRFILAGFDAAPFLYYAAASVYALTSREDPFPNVVLESASVGVPVVAFSGTTGAADFIRAHGGRLAHIEDSSDFANQITDLLALAIDPATREVPQLSLQHYVIDLLHHLNATARISVVVPNYNYGHLIERRLESIRMQTYPIYELIILDDNSTDDSVARIRSYCKKYAMAFDLHVNSINSGSVFRQWEKGAKLASGDIVWIAEADDTSEPTFLAALAAPFESNETVLSYSQSKQIDEAGNVLAPNYLAYTCDISDQWEQSYLSLGTKEISNSLCIKNTIPNVSGVLLRRSVLLNSMAAIGERLFDYKVAGDWLIYVHMLTQGGTYYCAESLNLHCRHQQSVTAGTDLYRHLAEVVAVQKEAGQLISLPASSIANATAYIELLRRQFGLPDLKT